MKLLKAIGVSFVLVICLFVFAEIFAGLMKLLISLFGPATGVCIIIAIFAFIISTFIIYHQLDDEERLKGQRGCRK
jgi:uncharacterized oligopeptide transporter (OPT) family protein